MHSLSYSANAFSLASRRIHGLLFNFNWRINILHIRLFLQRNVKNAVKFFSLFSQLKKLNFWRILVLIACVLRCFFFFCCCCQYYPLTSPYRFYGVLRVDLVLVRAWCVHWRRHHTPYYFRYISVQILWQTSHTEWSKAGGKKSFRFC